MFPRRAWLVVPGLALLAFVSFGIAQTAANTVPTGKVSNTAQAITVNDLKPADCSAITLTTITTFSGGGTHQATSAAELILGDSVAQSIHGQSGDDCILAGGGDDTLFGGNDIDVCIGGPGNDTLKTSCETQIQ